MWGAYEKTFLDIIITHPNCPTYVNKPIKDVYVHHEEMKKREYNERVLQIEKGSFTPIVGTTFGGWGKEAERHHKRIATLIAAKKREEYSDVINYTDVSFKKYIKITTQRNLHMYIIYRFSDSVLPIIPSYLYPP